MYIYLDESGDLGFDFNGKMPSKFFIITLLVCDDAQSTLLIKKSVERTLKNKIYTTVKRNIQDELKGVTTKISVKTYFFNNATKGDSWRVYSIILDKQIFANKFNNIDKHRVYNVVVWMDNHADFQTG